jgi:hypothetical protein
VKSYNKDNPDKRIIITVADKGGKSVVMFEKDYKNAMDKLIDDPAMYKKLEKDPTENIQKEMNDLIDIILMDHSIEGEERTLLQKCKKHNGVTPKMYGLPKVHKISDENPEVKLRPIVSCINSPTYDLSKFLADILTKSIDKQKYNVKNSKETCEFLSNQKIPENHTLASADVVSLFTNIPFHYFTEAVTERWSNIKKNTSLSMGVFLRLIRFCMEHSIFSYNDVIIQQLDGFAIGLPLSPPASDFVMEKLLDETRKRLIVEIPFIKKYVDDTIMCIPIVLEEYVLATLNSINPKLQFTLELERGKKIPFLDIEIIHEDNGSIKTQWYKKPIAIGRLLNYESCHPMSQKIGSAYGFINRVLSLTNNCSEKEMHGMIKEQLMKNNFPGTLVNGLMQKYRRRRAVNRENVTECKYRSLQTNVDGLSQQIQREINKVDPTIRMAFTPIRSVSKIYTRLKDRDDKWKASSIVYRIPCKICRKAYIGKTSQYMKKRIANIKRTQTVS